MQDIKPNMEMITFLIHPARRSAVLSRIAKKDYQNVLHEHFLLLFHKMSKRRIYTVFLITWKVILSISRR